MSDESPIYDPLAPDPDSEPATEAGASDFADHDSRGGVSPLWIVGGLLVLALFVAGAWWVFLRPPADLPPGETTPSGPVAERGPTPEVGTTPEESSVEEPPPPRVPLPPLDRSDPRVREEVSSLSGREEWVEWLAPEDLVRRFVASVTNVAEGQSPRAHVAHVAPKAPFVAETVSAEDGEAGETVLVIDEASYRRYDRLADVFASLDIGASVALYHDLEPLFEQAYAEIGDPRTTFRETLGEAIDRLLAVQVPGGDVELVRHATHYRFADPELEALSPAEKHLLRMGPANAEKVQQKLRFLRSALDL